MTNEQIESEIINYIKKNNGIKNCFLLKLFLVFQFIVNALRTDSFNRQFSGRI